MLLTLSSESVRNTVFTNESGQVLYKSSHPFKLGMGTTTIQKIMSNADPMDMLDRFDVMGEIEWHLFVSSTFRINGEAMQSNDFIPRHGITGRCVASQLNFLGNRRLTSFPDRVFALLAANEHLRGRTVTHIDGICYLTSWCYPGTTGQERRSQDITEASLGIVGPKRKPRLDVDPDVTHMLDLIVLTFVYVEKLRMDKERASRNAGGAGGGP
ncbi:hypothetical protein J3R83DRAFT_13214 [Lanmaoa asiatica]|nr:hypothetical protein J3R83DRAFT_13214 [Lanmaoa asiatica]